MVNYKEFYSLWITSRAEATIFAVTFFTIIFVDLLAGVQAGISAACLIVLLRTTKTHLNISFDSQDDVTRLSLIGALTFLSTGKIADLQQQLAAKQPGQIILMDLSNIRNLDMSGANAVIELFNQCQSSGIHFFIKGLPRRFELIFKACGGSVLLNDWYLVSEHELRKKITAIAPKSSHGRLIHGIHRFYVQAKHDDKRLFESISQGQDPHTLFVTCSDSRIVPSLMTSSDPGELFIIRNIGNFIPPYQESSQFSEAAALEFALSSFDITDIVICGHINCGAIKACQAVDQALPPTVDFWIKMIRSQLKIDDDLNKMIYMNIINQINNLKLYPIVQKKLEENILNIHGWFFDFDKSVIYEWNQKKNEFKSIIPALESSVVFT
jgi:carbonic anhydrase